MFFIFIFIWLRGTLPRLRYDQFMAFGWKRLIPISLVWIVAVATIRAMRRSTAASTGSYLLVGLGVAVVLFLALFFIGEHAPRTDEAEREATPQGVRRRVPRPADARRRRRPRCRRDR